MCGGGGCTVCVEHTIDWENFGGRNFSALKLCCKCQILNLKSMLIEANLTSSSFWLYHNHTNIILCFRVL